jgi:ATP-dependent protease HslVU (ClpYQ) peptidase subunit
MSVVACRVFTDGYEIAADSILVRGYTQDKGGTRTFSKLFEVNNIVVGGVGAAEELALLNLFCHTHWPNSGTERGMLEFFNEFASWKKKHIDKGNIENTYLIGYDGKVFHVAGWFISEVTTFEAIGAGMDYALAALYLGCTTHRAVETAIELSVYCEGPIRIVKKRLVEEE